MKENNFPRKHRLLKRIEFINVRRHGVYVKSQGFNVQYCENKLKHPRLGIIVSKKVDKRASRRNLIKRKIRESFRLLSKKMPPVDIVVLAKDKFAFHSKHIISDSIISCFIKIQKTLDKMDCQ